MTQTSNGNRHPADVRPGMYVGPQGPRTLEEWRRDARDAYDNPVGYIVRMR